MDKRNVSHLVTTVPSINAGDSTLPANMFDFYSLPLVNISTWITTISLPIAFVLGVFGNVMTVVIIHRLQSNRSALDRYFLCLAVTDLCVNVTGPLFEWMWTVKDFHPFGLHDVACKIGLFVLNTATACSSWLVVLMVTHMAMSVVWPHLVNVLCTAKTSWVTIVSVIIFLSLAWSHVLYGLHVSGGFCTYKQDYMDFLTEVWVKINISLFSVLPFICLIISNVMLVVKLRTSVKEAGDQFAATDRQQSERERKVNSITLTALVVSMAYIIFTLPFAVKSFFTVAVSDSEEVQDIHDLEFNYFLHYLVINVFYFNNSMNFYLYCMTGQRFRKEFHKLLTAGSTPSC